MNLANRVRSGAIGALGVSLDSHSGQIQPEIEPVLHSENPLNYRVGSSSMTVRIRGLSLEYKQFLQERPLSRRELEILHLIVQGKSTAEMAQALHLTDGTVKSHVRSILYKLGVRDRTQAAVLALRAGLVD